MDAFDSIVTCPRCPHGAGLHDGSGCNEPRCACRSTKETVMSDSIELLWQEDREKYRSASRATG